VDELEDGLPGLNADTETDIKELMGLFDVPAFARRGLEVELLERRLHERCRAARREMLEMVRLRLRQWAAAVAGPDAWSSFFTTGIEPLWSLSDVDEPRWAFLAGPRRRQRAAANDLIASVVRFNGRWARFVKELNLAPVNHAIEQYNRYYVLEKECVMGSARLAVRYFVPLAKITTESLLAHHPILPVPELLVSSRPVGRA
jgi:hypothetical protein